MKTLITPIREYNYPQGKTPHVTIISPPPSGKTGLNSAKYKDGDKKVKALIPQFEALSKKENAVSLIYILLCFQKSKDLLLMVFITQMRDIQLWLI